MLSPESVGLGSFGHYDRRCGSFCVRVPRPQRPLLALALVRKANSAYAQLWRNERSSLGGFN